MNWHKMHRAVFWESINIIPRARNRIEDSAIKRNARSG